jgi:hypothetical protein
MTMKIETISEPETTPSSSSNYDYDYDYEHRLRLSTEPKYAVPTTKILEEPFKLILKKDVRSSRMLVDLAYRIDRVSREVVTFLEQNKSY